jgi:phage tail sheath gpL-like
MAVPFASVPSNLRVPFVSAEFDSSRAQQGPAILAYTALLVGQKIAAGSAAANSLHKVTSADQVVPLAGRGSQLHRMAASWFANNRATEAWIGVLEDNAAGVAATGTLTVTGPATAAGTIHLYVGGQYVPVAVASGDAAAAIATKIAAALPSSSNLRATGAAVDAVVTVTARNKGTAGNDIDLRVNYQDGQALPAGVGVAVVAMASGATNPVLTTLIAALGDRWFNVIPHPYTDATSLTALETELASRFGPMRMIDGVAITSAVGTQAQLGVIGDARNSPHSCIVAQPGKSPITPPDEFAAAVAAQVAASAANDPAQPFQTLQLAGVLPPAEADRFTLQERNLALYDGISTSRVGGGGVVQIERLVTTNQTNAAGTADTAYLAAETLFTLMYLRHSFRARILGRYPRHKLAGDGTRVGSGQKIVTPKTMKAEAVAWAREMEALGLLEGVDAFKENVVVERSATDPNRLDILLPPDLVNQLVVTATSVQFRL